MTISYQHNPRGEEKDKGWVGALSSRRASPCMGEGRGEGRTEQGKRGTMGNEHLTNRYRGEAEERLRKGIEGKEGFVQPEPASPWIKKGTPRKRRFDRQTGTRTRHGEEPENIQPSPGVIQGQPAERTEHGSPGLISTQLSPNNPWEQSNAKVTETEPGKKTPTQKRAALRAGLTHSSYTAISQETNSTKNPSQNPTPFDHDRRGKTGGGRWVCRRNRQVSLPKPKNKMQDARDNKESNQPPPPAHPKTKGKTPPGEPHQPPPQKKNTRHQNRRKTIDTMSEGKRLQEQLHRSEEDVHLVRKHKEPK